MDYRMLMLIMRMAYQMEANMNERITSVRTVLSEPDHDPNVRDYLIVLEENRTAFHKDFEAAFGKSMR